MDNNSSTVADSCGTTPSCNGSARRSPLNPSGMAVGRPATLMDQVQSQPHVVRVVVHRDDHGYGMKVSGDNPVYVQSVKEGGAAERAGLHAGDKIIMVNGVDVTHFTHTQVVARIKSYREVVLTVQQRMQALRAMGSPSLHNRPATIAASPSSQRITGPQPVDNEKQWQLQQDREKCYRLMIEKEQRHLDTLRSELASSPDETKMSDLAKTERTLHTLQAELLRSQTEHSADTSRSPRSVSLPSSLRPTNHRHSSTPTSPNGNTAAAAEVPPPLPRRNQPVQRTNTANNHPNPRSIDLNSIFLNHEINANQPVGAPNDDSPPPLPPRTIQSAPIFPNNNMDTPLDAVNSINKQMSYPLVATCTTINDNSSNPTHHRTKSSPDSLLNLGPSDSARKLSESMNDLTGRQETWEGAITPPGTPPPPYPSPRMNRRDRNSNNMDEGDISFVEHMVDGSSPEALPFRGVGSNNRLPTNSSPIHAASSPLAQQHIRSMEDDELSDQEMSQVEDHGHFKSLSLLWGHLPHLAVFTNYVLSNADPNSLLFYLLTDLYKEGNAKEMRKWAFEIHSCFLVPGAPLRLGNVDENVAREVDDVLTRESDKEEILRKIFFKARVRAKEELTRQLTYFQQNRTRGLGTIFGPTDQELEEVYHDKAKETKLYENLFLAKLEPYLEEFDKENFDPKRYYTAAALTTVMYRIFQMRPASHALDRYPTFVNKEKSLRNKLIEKSKKKINLLNHQFVAKQYYTVITCNNCHQIIYGIGLQGYQCSACLINLHRLCVKLYDDTCPGPIKKKDRGGIRQLIGMSGDHNRMKKTASSFLQMEKERRQMEEQRDSSFELNDIGEGKTGHPVSRSGSDRRPDAVREEPHRHQDSEASRTEVQNTGDNDKTEGGTPDSSISLPITGNRRKVGSNINRSESVKEQSEKRKQRRNISDPSHNTSCDVDLERQQTSFTKNTDSGSSSNSNVSCNGRLSESPSNSVDVHHASLRTNSESDSDMDEADPLTWQQLLPEEEVKNLSAHEKKRQDVINELFHTEGSHVRNLKVLYKIFYRRLHESQILKPDDLNLIFPNIKEMLDIHTEINKEMRRIRKEDPLVKETLGDSLVKMFCGPQGEALQKAAAIFCERQQLALEFIKKRRERDSKFDSLLTECEKKRQCRRLPLQGIVPTEMQRLSKYPLLLERLIGSIDHKDPSQADELAKLKRVQQMSREILNYVNEAAKVALNKHRLEEIQSHLDPALFERADHSIVGEFRNFDLTRYKLLLEGSMQLRRPNKAILPVHVLLLEEMVVILHKESEKYLLKFFQSGSPAQPQPLSPIIKINTLLVRSNAVCKNSLFLISSSTSTSQMYDLIAEDDTKRNWWFRHFTDAAEAHNIREGKPSKRPGAGVIGVVTADTESESDHELPTPTTTHSAERSSEVTEEVSDGEKDSKREDTAEEVESSEVGGGGDLQVDGDRAESQEPEMIGGGGGDEKIKVTAEEWPLIQPSQVNVAIPPVHTAETTLTPLEQIRRKDALVKQALAEKEGLVADMLSIPREDFHHIADMASADVASGGGHLTERLLASIFQVNQLQKAVNSSLDITEADVIAAKGGKHPACASQDVPAQEKSVIPIVPVSLVAEIAASLSSQLTTLLSEVKEVVKERDMLRKEFDKVKERLHEEHNLHSPVQYEECNSDESGTEIFSEAATGEIQ